jgi:glycosyltransferase involved in cell wall biosynthesis
VSDRRLHVLVMPEDFPRRPDHIGGIFTLDYIASIKPYCDVTVLMPGHGDRRGMSRSADESEAVEYVTWTPWFRGGGSFWQRLGRLESLYQLGRLERFVPAVDLIHAHGPVFHGVAAHALGKKLGVPVAVTVHTHLSKLLRRARLRWLTRRTLERVDCVCPVSHDLRRQIAEAGIKPKRVEVTYNPVDTDLFRPPASRDRLNRRMVFAGRLEEYKGGLRVVRAFAEIADRWPGWTLAIAGDGPERGDIELFLRGNLAVARQVELIGPYTKPQLAELFAASDCFVYPSRRETFGLVLAEAMSAGLPVIGPNCTAPPEFVEDGCGLLVPPDDVPAIADAMDQLLTKLPSYRHDAIREVVVQRFGFAAFGQRLLALYRDLCQRSGGPTCAASQV